MNLPVDISDVHGTAVKNAARLAIRGVVNTLEGTVNQLRFKKLLLYSNSSIQPQSVKSVFFLINVCLKIA
jgi:hypothetical protein